MTKQDKRKRGWLTFGSWMANLVPLIIFAGFNYDKILQTPTHTVSFFGIALIGTLIGVVAHQLKLWKMTSVKLLTTSGILWFLTSMIPNILIFAFIAGGGMLLDDIAFKPHIEKIKEKYKHEV